MTLMDIVHWVAKNAKDRGRQRNVVTFDDMFLFKRYEFFRIDEVDDRTWDARKEKYPVRPGRLPWWLPFNVFLHHWGPEGEVKEGMHDHPRWSISIVLNGTLVENTPWKSRTLTRGSVVFRSHRYIHAFDVPAQEEEVWTLFIVGRRKHRQNTFKVTKR